MRRLLKGRQAIWTRAVLGAALGVLGWASLSAVALLGIDAQVTGQYPLINFANATTT